MIRPSDPGVDTAALETLAEQEADRIRSAQGAPPPAAAFDDRLAVIGEALDAAARALERARERNRVRRDVPGSLGRLRPLAAPLLRAYNALFARQREIAADQNDALVALVHAVRELAKRD